MAVGSPGALKQAGTDAQPGTSHTFWKVSIEVAKRECVFFRGETVHFSIHMHPKGFMLVRTSADLTS